MEKKQQMEHGKCQVFRHIPVVRLDSGAVRIPVEMVDNIQASEDHRVLRISVKPASCCAWR